MFLVFLLTFFFFFSSRRRHTIFDCDWSSDVCSSDLLHAGGKGFPDILTHGGDDIAHLLLRKLRHVAALHVLFHVFTEEKRGHQICSVFLQRDDRRLIHQMTMLDLIDTGLRSPAHTLYPVDMRNHTS